MRIAIGSDHVGFELKGKVSQWLIEQGHEVVDVGPTVFDPQDDYPDFARAVAEQVSRGDSERGIVICSTGVGSCMTANKVRGVRAALCQDIFCARMSRQHNNANVLCLGANVAGPGLVREIVNVWVNEPFSEEERHARRVAKMSQIEQDEGR